MPWKNQGGGPWGSGPKGPWGSGPQSPGPRPPDLEDLLRRGQDKLQTILPGGNFSGIGIALLLVAALAAVVSPTTFLYFALAQFPIYLLPWLLGGIAARIRRREAADGR